MSDIIIGGALIIAVLAIVVKLMKRHKQGKSSCGCGHCGCDK